MRIAVISISLSIVVNLLTYAVVTGFQNEIRRKVTGFSAPLFIQNQNNKDFYEADPICISERIEKSLKNTKGISRYEKVAYKAGMLQSATDPTGKWQQEIVGVIFKGVSSSYNWDFIKEHLRFGRIPNFKGKEAADEIIVSEKIANQLRFKLNQEVTTFFVKDRPLSRKFKIVGIYNTGFDDYDNKLVICDIRNTQKLNDWGTAVQLEIGDTLAKNKCVIQADIQGQKNDLYYDWGKGIDRFNAILLPTGTNDTTIKVKVYRWTAQKNPIFQGSSSLHLKLKSNSANASNLKEVQKTALNTSGSKYEIYFASSQTIQTKYEVEVNSDAGTSSQYISGYEIHLNDWNDLITTKKDLSTQNEMMPTESSDLVRVVSILDLESDLFNWLGFLDVNVAIILTLMLLIGIINMGSALLVLIVIRTQFIGLMKALGAQNKSLRKIFLYQSAYLIGKGLFWGNGIGLALYGIQKHWGLFALNPDIYYLDTVPMELGIWPFLALNTGTFLVCILALLIPSSIISRVQPIKAIKFN